VRVCVERRKTSLPLAHNPKPKVAYIRATRAIALDASVPPNAARNWIVEKKTGLPVIERPPANKKWASIGPMIVVAIPLSTKPAKEQDE